MLAELVFRPFELLVNRGLRESTSAQAVAERLEGRTLGLALDGTPFALRLTVSGGSLSVALPDGAAPDASISGTTLSIGRLLRDDPQSAVRNGLVRMSGDTEVADLFRELLHFAAPDLEEELSHIVGDPVAHAVGNVVRAFAHWGETAGTSLSRSLSEYLQEETRVVPTQFELREFGRRVDDLVNDVARAEARIQRLAQSGTLPGSREKR